MKNLILFLCFASLAQVGFAQESQTVDQQMAAQIQAGVDAIGGVWQAVAALIIGSTLVGVAVGFFHDKLGKDDHGDIRD